MKLFLRAKRALGKCRPHRRIRPSKFALRSPACQMQASVLNGEKRPLYACRTQNGQLDMAKIIDKKANKKGINYVQLTLWILKVIYSPDFVNKCSLILDLIQAIMDFSDLL